MAIIVKKFGGTSVGDIRRMKHVAKIIKDFRTQRPADQLVVVVSAMAGETNRLITLAKSCVPHPAPRELDVMLATGEQVSVALLAMALNECGIPAQSFLAHQTGIRTDNRFSNAQITEIADSELARVLNSGSVAVVAGFQGVTINGDLTTLGRGGSDITAVAIAAALKAKACYIYTDVPGVYSADPRICRDARLWKTISHEEMLELASHGAKVLHPRSVYFAQRYQVPLVVLSAFEEPARFDSDAGTWIVTAEERAKQIQSQKDKNMEQALVTGIALRTDEARLTLRGIADSGATLGSICAEFHRRGISIDMITQMQGREQQSDVCCLVPDERSSEALAIAREYVPKISAVGAELDRDIARVTVVGIGLRAETGIAARVFELLLEHDITLRMVSSSDLKISLVIPRKYADQAVRILHQGLVVSMPPADESKSAESGS